LFYVVITERRNQTI